MLRRLSRSSSRAREPEAVFLEKCLEKPIIVLPEDTKKVDMIGPPNPLSNLRPIVRLPLLHETALQERLRRAQDETQNWNESFWAAHNSTFIKEKRAYIKAHLSPTEDKQTLTADEMSEFYKSFLDENWGRHVQYNFEWYKRNFTLLYLALRVSVERLTLQVF